MRCDTLVKEREAVQTIMEHKIKVLVQSVAQAAANMMAASNAGTVNRTAGQDLTKVTYKQSCPNITSSPQVQALEEGNIHKIYIYWYSGTAFFQF